MARSGTSSFNVPPIKVHAMAVSAPVIYGME
jgi:hypothetical protein